LFFAHRDMLRCQIKITADKKVSKPPVVFLKKFYAAARLADRKLLYAQLNGGFITCNHKRKR